MPPAKKPVAAKVAAARPEPKGDPDLDLISSLADILNSTGLTEIELDRRGTRFRVAKTVNVVTTMQAAPPPAIYGHGHVAPADTPVAVAKPLANGDQPGAVKSPMVGTVYLAPTPGTPNFVDVGSMVKEGQTVLIIEAMKTMNQIHAPRSGKVTHVFVENGSPVEYGEALLAIE